MPLIQLKTVAGVWDSAKKEKVIKKLTDAIVAVEGESARAVTWVLIEEVPSGQWGIAGDPITTDVVKAIYGAGKN